VSVRQGVPAAAAGAAIALLAACQSETYVGSECASGSCEPLRWCIAADQQLPTTCSARVCNGAEVPPDREACEACALTNAEFALENVPRLRCACMYCAVPLAACRESHRVEPDGDLDRDNRCRAIVSCALGARCTGSECYCGQGVDLGTCLDQETPTGPCAQVIADAAGCVREDATCVFDQISKLGSAIHRAFQLSECMGNPVFGIAERCPPEL
jgi:hypothetical protein